jgi:pimeloyl-ACP methyl ester carboxylesterase
MAREDVRRLVFSHANGFPAGTYRVLFERWRQAGWTVEAVPAYGHDPRHPVTSNWPHLRAQLLEQIQTRPEPVALVGHSLGGYLSVMGACHLPQQVRAVVMLDSPLVGGWKAHSLHMAKRTGLISRVSPGRISSKRRVHWPSREAAHAHFAAKPSFAAWDPRMLDDYIACGLQSGPESGVVLSFEREIETRIYNSLPHHLMPLMQRRPPTAGMAFIGGTQSAEVRQVGLAYTRAATRERISWIEGPHLFPMHKPEATADEVLGWLDRLLAS